MIVLVAVVLASCSPSGSTPSASKISPVINATPLIGRIAFDRMNGPVDYEGPYIGTFTANIDGSGERELPLPKGWAGPAGPVWSPDGSELLVSLWRQPDGPGRAAIIRPDGSDFRVLAPGKLDASMGCSAWSPDGSALLCSIDSNHYALEGIYSIHADGSGLARMTTSPYHDTQGAAGECGGGDSEADYSPDGGRFVFMRKRCGTGPDPSSDEAAALYVENTDGSGLRQITAYGTARSHPGGSVRWSPDGSEILFMSQDRHLYVVRPDGTGQTELGLDGLAYGPAWSPDGRWIIFSMFLPPAAAAQIYRAWPDGTHVARVSDTPNSEFMASWGPATGP
jgi:Tol biopolymer transport system component